MVASTSATERRQPARPLPGAVWQAHVVDAGAITAELGRLWRRFGAGDGPAGESGGRSGEDGALVASCAETRASTLNLTAVAQSRAGGKRIEGAVTHLSDLYPSRATILIADTERADDQEGGLDVYVTLLERPAEKGQPAIRFECVTVEVGAAKERYLASIASPLLVADLPDFLWWAGSAVRDSGLFTDLLGVSDRVILDSAGFAGVGELRHLAALLARNQGLPKMSDFAWARLTPWRQIVTQFFDPPSARPALDALDGVSIRYGGVGDDGRSGFSGALLFAGWLGARLGWRAPGELLPVRDEPGSWRLTARTGRLGREREVSLILQRSSSPLAERSLDEVVLLADGGRGGEFRVERIDALGLATASEGPGMPAVQRMVFAGLLDDAALLAEELRMFGRDPVFEEALLFAAALAPEGGADTAGAQSA
ncbi:MAG: hypothetical protein AVDCRST_MAG19-415 [uncultured Thermomicrobiales bacterium]|uniref:Glucose-6-phosphate dehydrogenase n=1 Tax=uncultured Thermomicrobiales bacterium TaxID=1645740 RepID=A0A6J4UB06_9BACT|nr:MAG: hypothetical protein AVDCRST_MAG19-415 [uncultured Thermomicrobiales bacterium]